jgi:hypothetical protein
MLVRPALYALLGLLVSCKVSEKVDDRGEVLPKEAAASAPVPAAPVSAAPAAAAPSVSATPAAPPAAPTLADLFDGPPDPAITFTERKKSEYGGRGTTVGIPKGWKLDMPNVAILILASPDKNAMLFAHDEMGAITNGSVKFWSNRAGFAHKADITWEESLSDGKFGEKHGPVQVGLGKGTLAKKPATFWQIRFKKENILIAAALTDDASDEVRRELMNAVRAVHPLEKGPQPYNPFG